MPQPGKSKSPEHDQEDPQAAVEPSSPGAGSGSGTQSEPFVGKWNQLVSTTNWEKGRIICEWREALVSAGAAAAAYADEAWASLVGGVTGQHVGRLRRVYQQFGAQHAEYPSLYWSHFQVAGDWDDAEMWLEGAVQNSWSVSQMRASRWEAHGVPAELKPRDEDILVGEVDEDVAHSAGRDASIASPAADRHSAGADVDAADDDQRASASREASPARTENQASAAAHGEVAAPARPFENLPELPDDLTLAFEQFKLVILAHKMSDWRDVSCDTMLACLDALKALATLPSDG